MKKDMDMAFIDSEEFMFTPEFNKIVRKVVKQTNIENVEKLLRKISDVVEGENNPDVFLALALSLQGYLAKKFYENPSSQQ